MNIEVLRHICNSFPGVTEDIKWGNDLCFLVGEKMFCVTGLERVPTAASFKVPSEAFEELAARDGFKPAPYLARYKWVHVDNIECMHEDEWREHLHLSYNLIKSKLPKKVQQAIDAHEKD